MHSSPWLLASLLLPLCASCGGGGHSQSGGEAGDGAVVSTVCGSNPVPQSFNAGLTWYQNTSPNNCAIPWPSSGQPQSGVTMSTAIATNLYDDPSGSGACGKCVELYGQILLVVDQCPNCASNHLDIGGQSTYQTVTGNAGGGSVPDHPGVPVKFVPCPVTGNIQYAIKDSSQPYYLAMIVLDARYGIQSVSYRATGTSDPWKPMTARTDADARWSVTGFKIPNPIDFQVTDEWGQVVEDDGVAWSPGATVAGRSQFPTCP